jgi:hypothetical protein
LCGLAGKIAPSAYKASGLNGKTLRLKSFGTGGLGKTGTMEHLFLEAGAGKKIAMPKDAYSNSLNALRQVRSGRTMREQR